MLDNLTLIVLYFLMKKKQNRLIHSRYRKLYLSRLSAFEKKIRQRRIPRVALLDPAHSAWSRLVESRDDQAMITLTGFDFNSFFWLLAKFQPLYDNNSPFLAEDGSIIPIGERGRGRPRIVTAVDCLGLCLAWTRTRGSNMVLQLIFGMTATPVSMYLRFSRRILVGILENEPLAQIKIPDDNTIKGFQQTIRERFPALDGCWCTMDGLKLYIQKSGNNTKQNNFYNGWTHDHYVSAVLVFCPDGSIPIACFNVPGSIHDSCIADWGNIYKKLEGVYKRVEGKCTVDSAFSKKRFPFLLKSGLNFETINHNTETYRDQLILNMQATSMRQCAEWGMRAIQSSFPRLKD
jgi:DDE superfamily endonuclease